MFIGGQWFEIPNLDISRGTLVSSLCFEAIESTTLSQRARSEATLSALVLVMINPVRELIILEEDLDLDQETFVLEEETFFITQYVSKLQELIDRRITKTQKKERYARTSIADLKLTALMVAIFDMEDSYTEYMNKKLDFEYCIQNSGTP